MKDDNVYQTFKQFLVYCNSYFNTQVYEIDDIQTNITDINITNNVSKLKITKNIK